MTGPFFRGRGLVTICLIISILLLGALWNGHPLLYYDSRRYLAFGLDGDPTSERPVFYSLFCYVFGASTTSVWTIVAAQCALTALVLQKLTSVLGCRMTMGWTLLLLVVLFLSGAPWIQGQVMADAFAPILVLTTAIIALQSRFDQPTPMWIKLLFVFSAVTHYSHLLMATLFSATLLFRSFLVHRRIATTACRNICTLVVVSWLLVPVTNRVLQRPVRVVQGTDFFLLGRFNEDGLLDRLMIEHCSHTPYALCSFAGRLTDTAASFLWGSTSPLKTLRGSGTREALVRDNPVYRMMVMDVLRYYPHLVARGALVAFWRQLTTFSAGGNLVPMPTTGRFEVGYQKWFKREFSQLKSARQQTGTLQLNLLQSTQMVLTALGFVALGYVLHRGLKQSDRVVISTCAIVVFFYVTNAAVCGCLSNVRDRYQARIAWLVPLTSVMLLNRSRERKTEDPRHAPVVS